MEAHVVTITRVQILDVAVHISYSTNSLGIGKPLTILPPVIAE